jgi:cell wall-associated NlpC family hydrolase
VLAEIDTLGHALDRATEAYNGATYRLQQIHRSLQQIGVEYDVARHNYRVAVQRLGIDLRARYVSGSTDPTLDVILGAHSLDDVITGLDEANTIAHEDAQVINEVVTFRATVAQRAAALRRARRTQEAVVARRNADRQRIANGLAQQRRLLSSIRGEIATLRHQEAVRQAQLAAAAAAQLEAQRLQAQEALHSVVVGATAQSAPGNNGFPSAGVVPPSSIGSRVVAIAEQYLGRPYVWGAAGPYSFDCSGLVTYVFAQVGIVLPHFAAAQWGYGTYVSLDQLEPGDLVFFESLGHVGIYVGNGEYIQAPQPGDVVKITPLSEPWSAANYYGAKRIFG